MYIYIYICIQHVCMCIVYISLSIYIMIIILYYSILGARRDEHGRAARHGEDPGHGVI